MKLTLKKMRECKMPITILFLLPDCDLNYKLIEIKKKLINATFGKFVIKRMVKLNERN